MDKFSKKMIYAVSLAVIAINLYFSIEFFSKISTFFAVLIVITELVMAIYTRNIHKVDNAVIKTVMIIICISATLFSVLGVVANGYNFITENKIKQFKEVKNDSYNDFLKDKENKQNTLDSYRKELNNYPDFNTYIGTVPKWERTENLTIQYNAEKQKIMDKIDGKQKEIDIMKKPSKTLNIKSEASGYNELFTEISKITGIKVDTLILLLVVFIAFLMQMIIYSSLLISKFETKNLESKDKILGQKFKKYSFRIKNIFPKTTQKINVLENKNIPKILEKTNVLEKKENVLENILEAKKEIPKTNDFENVLEKVKIYLRDFKHNDLINKFQDKFELTEYDYKKIRDRLVKEGIIETKNRRMYYKGNLRAVK
jgi:hypothetical protein